MFLYTVFTFDTKKSGNLTYWCNRYGCSYNEMDRTGEHIIYYIIIIVYYFPPSKLGEIQANAKYTSIMFIVWINSTFPSFISILLILLKLYYTHRCPWQFNRTSMYTIQYIYSTCCYWYYENRVRAISTLRMRTFFLHQYAIKLFAQGTSKIGRCKSRLNDNKCILDVGI